MCYVITELMQTKIVLEEEKKKGATSKHYR